MRSRHTFLAMICLVSGPVLAQSTTADRRSVEQMEQRDMALSIASAMVVESIDRDAMRVRLNGQWYELLSAGLEERSDGLEIDDLKPGMSVFVQTDGSEASSDNQPLILAIWSQ